MHTKLEEATRKLERLEGLPLSKKKKKVFDGIKEILNDFETKETLTASDEKVLDAIIVIIDDYMVKDSSVT